MRREPERQPIHTLKLVDYIFDETLFYSVQNSKLDEMGTRKVVPLTNPVIATGTELFAAGIGNSAHLNNTISCFDTLESVME